MYIGIWLEGLEEPEMTGYWRLYRESIRGQGRYMYRGNCKSR